LPKRIGGSDIVAVVAAFDERTLNRLREMRGDHSTVLVEESQSKTVSA
jgi:hypothetical protein